ncbi:MAG TPA: hypothetical protein VG898_02635 [Solirubrobacterales bacterium]|nr:hypothetical protein [Solirubrobacterales bacterium]
MEDLGPQISYMVLGRGVPVFSSDGVRLGKVVRTQRDSHTHMFDGIVIDTKPGPGGRRFVDAPEVDTIHEGGVVLAIDATQAAALPKP